MQEMSGLDAGFLALETPTQHLHVAAVLVFEPPDPARVAQLAARLRSSPRAPWFTEPRPLHPTRVRDLVEARLHLVPPFRRKAMRVPLGIGHPVWVEDPDFDLDDHLHRACLASPGGPRELAEYVAEIMSRPLDRDRPLWELHVVEGLEAGHVALIPKVHHALVDGVAGAALLAAFLDVGPEPRDVPPPASPWVPGPLPSAGELLGRAVMSLLDRAEEVPDTLRRTAGVLAELATRHRRLREEEEREPPPVPFRAPRTSLNGSISARRRYAFTQVPLEEVRAVRAALGGTVNDVVLAAVSGALRRLLAERGEDPDDPLVALVPLSTRTVPATAPTDTASAAARGLPARDLPTRRRLAAGHVAGHAAGAPGPADGSSNPLHLGNEVSAMLVSLATPIADPVERLHAVARATALAKQQAAVLDHGLVDAWARLAFPALASRAARLATSLRIFDHLAPPFNLVVSNVPGPQFPLWCDGARLVGLYPVGPVVEGAGLNVTVVGYDGSLCVGALGCRRRVPEVERFGHHLTDAVAELVKAAARRAGAAP